MTQSGRKKIDPEDVVRDSNVDEDSEVIEDDN